MSKADNRSGSPAWEALKTAIYRAIQRQQYAARVGEDDDLVEGGSAGVVKHLAAQIDVERPFHTYWSDVIDAMRALQAEAVAESERERSERVADGELLAHLGGW